MGNLADNLRKGTALAALTLSPTGYAAAQQRATGTQQQATVVAEGHPADGAPLPNEPEPAVTRPVNTASQQSRRGLIERAEGVAHKIDSVEDTIHLRPEIDPYKVELTVPIKQDKAYDQPSTSRDMAGVTAGAKKGVRGNWSADLFGRRTSGYGPLNPEPTRSYGGEIETHLTAKEGPFSIEGRIAATGGEERFKAYMTRSEMDAELAGQGVPSCFYPQGEAAIKASLPTTNQPLVKGEASAYAELDPKFTYLKEGLIEAGLTRFGGGGDVIYESLGHGRQAEICGTGLNFGNSIAASVCEVKGEAGGHDNLHMHQGLQFNLAVKPSRLADDAKKLRQVMGRHTARSNIVAENGGRRDKSK